MRDQLSRLDEAMTDMAWSLWGPMGVSSWEERSIAAVVEVEPLLAFTAFVSPGDQRLNREVLEWSRNQMPLLSVRQFKHVVTSQRWPFEGEINDFGASLSVVTGRNWPGSGLDAGQMPRSDRPAEADMRAPWTLQLRLRSVFGVSARAEIIRVLLLNDRPFTITELSDRVAYTRRQVDAEADQLVAAGLLRKAAVSGPTKVQLGRPDLLLELCGPTAKDVDWAPVFRVLTGLRDLSSALSSGRWSEPRAEVARQLRALESSLWRVESAPGVDDKLSTPDEIVAAALAIIDRLPIRVSL